MRLFSPDKGFSANLDLLRAIAVLLVLAQHLCKRFYIDQVAGMPTSSWGLFGVLLFFVHTCLVLMYSMDRRPLSGWPLLKNFATRRLFRIYPLSILAVVVALSLHLDSDINGIHGLSRGEFPGIVSAASNLLLIQNLTGAKSIVNVLWSLPFELQMYALLPFFFLWIHKSASRSKSLCWPLLAIWAFSVAAAAMQPRVPALSRFSVLVFIPNFLPGVIACTLPRRPRLPSLLWPLFILTLVVAFAARPALSTGWILCLLLGLMIPLFREMQLGWLRWIANRIATYSYGIYLSHQFSLWIVFGPLASHSPALRICVLLGTLTALPVLLYHGIEKPMIKFGVRVADRVSGPSAVPSLVARPNLEVERHKLELSEEVAS
jgi:peptidoglycan/LPS O-acetylase OafA/YrhL